LRLKLSERRTAGERESRTEAPVPAVANRPDSSRPFPVFSDMCPPAAPQSLSLLKINWFPWVTTAHDELSHVTFRAYVVLDDEPLESFMWVLLIYVVLMIAGSAVDLGIGAVAAHVWSDTIALPIFLACYFGTLALAWVIAVRIAESMKLTT
jgi:hypothetical protein